MSISAVVWDVDGTLVDSEPLHQRAMRLSCFKHNVDLADIPYDKFLGTNQTIVWNTLRARFPSTLDITDWVREHNDFYREHSGTLLEIPHAREMVQALANLGVPQAAVSNSNRVVVDLNLRAVKLANFMEFSISFDDVVAGKPDPTPYRMAISRLGLTADKVLVVEDSMIGVISAKAAGAKVLHYDPAQKDAPEADATIRSLIELPRHLLLAGFHPYPAFAAASV